MLPMLRETECAQGLPHSQTQRNQASLAPALGDNQLTEIEMNFLNSHLFERLTHVEAQLEGHQLTKTATIAAENREIVSDLVAALAACQFELVSLAPRLTPAFRTNAVVAADMAKAALAKANTAP